MSNDNQLVVKKVLHAVGGNSKVLGYGDHSNKINIDIFIGENRPSEGMTTYSTIGLSEYSVGLVLEDQKEVRVELIGACASSTELFADIMSNCAYQIINDPDFCGPGTICRNAISEYYKNIEMKHVLFTTPFLWNSLQSIETPNKYVSWLTLVPVSDRELDIVQAYGSYMLEEMLQQQKIDIFDLNRKSVM